MADEINLDDLLEELEEETSEEETLEEETPIFDELSNEDGLIKGSQKVHPLDVDEPITQFTHEVVEVPDRSLLRDLSVSSVEENEEESDA